MHTEHFIYMMKRTAWSFAARFQEKGRISKLKEANTKEGNTITHTRIGHLGIYIS
jgi:hypothetical protein